MIFDKYFLDELVYAVNIVDVISDKIKLEKINTIKYKALCPFHKEKSPSFIVDAKKQFFYCAGCSESGNVISFIMKHMDLPFNKAIEMLDDYRKTRKESAVIYKFPGSAERYSHIKKES